MFQVGDRVKVKRGSFTKPEDPDWVDPTRLEDKIGEVVEAPLGGGPVKVKFEPGVWPGDGKADVSPFVTSIFLERVPIQEVVLAYLTSGGSVRDRQQALADLALLQFFVVTEGEARRILRDYLAENKRGFCDRGIERFSNFVGFGGDRSPLHEDAVNLDDLLPGDVIQRYHRGKPQEVYVYLRKMDEIVATRVFAMRINGSQDRQARDETSFLADDVGLQRYVSNRWNLSNFVLRIDVGLKEDPAPLPLVQEADPELERLLEEEEEIERSMRSAY